MKTIKNKFKFHKDCNTCIFQQEQDTCIVDGENTNNILMYCTWYKKQEEEEE